MIRSRENYSTRIRIPNSIPEYSTQYSVQMYSYELVASQGPMPLGPLMRCCGIWFTRHTTVQMEHFPQPRAFPSFYRVLSHGRQPCKPSIISTATVTIFCNLHLPLCRFTVPFFFDVTDSKSRNLHRGFPILGISCLPSLPFGTTWKPFNEEHKRGIAIP